MPDRTALYAANVDKLAQETTRRLLRLWDSCAPWAPEDLDRFHDMAKPLIEAAAQVGVDLSTTYAAQVIPGGVTGEVSKLMPADASARLYDVADRIGRLIDSGSTFAEATASARSVVEDIGHDTAYRSARQSIAEAAPHHTKWQRRVTGKSCQWCLSLASAVWYSAADATFGHDRCDCLPAPVDEVAESNRQIIDAAGGEKAVKKYRQVNQLKRSERIARKRQEQARLEGLNEPDPARRERLSTREQEWETRAERAAERRRLITAP